MLQTACAAAAGSAQIARDLIAVKQFRASVTRNRSRLGAGNRWSGVTSQLLPPPGWYPDPSGEAASRWFDGREWTRHVSGVAPAPPNPAEAALAPSPIANPVPVAASPVALGVRLSADPRATARPWSTAPAARPEPALSDPILYWVMPVGRTWQAVVAPYLGLLAFFPFLGLIFGIAAIFIGIAALRLPSPDPRHGGRGRPILGMALGAVGALFWICVLVASLFS